MLPKLFYLMTSHDSFGFQNVDTDCYKIDLTLSSTDFRSPNKNLCPMLLYCYITSKNLLILLFILTACLALIVKNFSLDFQFITGVKLKLKCG